MLSVFLRERGAGDRFKVEKPGDHSPGQVIKVKWVSYSLHTVGIRMSLHLCGHPLKNP